MAGVRREAGRGVRLTDGEFPGPKGRGELATSHDAPADEQRPAARRYGTFTHCALDGVPSPSVTNIMYHPDWTRFLFSGTVTVSF